MARGASLLEVGTGFHRELTGHENIFLNGGILGMRRREIRERFDEIVAFAEIEGFVDTPVKHYSSGMYVRLAFAVASTLNSDILIVDEVLAVGDARFQRRCLGKMREISGSAGRTVLFVSHNMSAVRSLCPRTLWLEHGRVRQLDPTSEVIPRYFEGALDIRATAGDLSSAQRIESAHGERLRILGATINEDAPVYHGEPFTVSIEYSLNVDTPDISFGLGLSSSDGVRLMTLDSDLDLDARDLSATECGVAEVTVLALPLEPGVYSMDLAARSGNTIGLDYLSGCAWIHVLPGTGTSHAALREGGGVRLPSIWTWK